MRITSSARVLSNRHSRVEGRIRVDDIHDEINGKYRIYRSLVESEYD